MRVQSHSIKVHTVPRKSLTLERNLYPGFTSCQLWGEHAKLYGLLPLTIPPPSHPTTTPKVETLETQNDLILYSHTQLSQGEGGA